MKTLSTVNETNAALRRIENSLESQAKQDFSAHTGRILLVASVSGYNDSDDSVDVVLDPPARMRVCQTSTEDIRHWVDNWLDPYWNVELVQPHPALAGIRSMWVYGPSYCTDGRTEPSSDWNVERTTVVQRLADIFRHRSVAHGGSK